MSKQENDDALVGLQDWLSSGVFAALDDEARKEFFLQGAIETFPVGAFVAQQGKTQEIMAVVVEGEVSVTCHAHGDIVHLADIGAGGLVGEMSLVDRHPASADVVVKDAPARLWTIQYSTFDAFLETHPALGLKVYRIIAAELCRLLRCNSESMLHRKDSMRSRFLDMDY